MKQDAKHIIANVSAKPSLANQLSLILVLTTSIAIVLTTSVFTCGVGFRIYHDTENQLQSLAHVISQNTQAALAFKDSESAATTLMGLQSAPEISAAFIYDAENHLFASYSTPQVKDIDLSQATLKSILGLVLPMQIEIQRPIAKGGEILGLVRMYADTYTIWLKWGIALLLGILVAMLSVTIAVWFGLRLSRSISLPLMELTQAAEKSH
ncbi:CHASE sensor domain-containing protein [Methylocucumis oryzae]|uniref:Periplasmic sensor domain-containing protein n=1 Tax=Methylocucumis oryzae TaxID=1632867 RepID=A0A0F3IJG8_9GAMM|nr:CHASE sensor domain-containing protein [Methylocucumis oryzae]KJV06851.1 hypothetical protein VZ94_08585 [Methylocucumis oryzae]